MVSLRSLCRSLLRSVPLAPESLSRPMCMDGSGMQEPPEGCAPVPRILCGWPPLFASACIQYCQTNRGPPLSLAQRTARERAGQSRETEVQRMRRRKSSIVSHARHSHAFPSVSLSSFLFLWDSEQISNRSATAPNRGSHGREIRRIGLRYHLTEWRNNFELWHLAAGRLTLIVCCGVNECVSTVQVHCIGVILFTTSSKH